jgi:hypothetical protein
MTLFVPEPTPAPTAAPAKAFPFLYSIFLIARSIFSNVYFALASSI